MELFYILDFIATQCIYLHLHQIFRENCDSLKNQSNTVDMLR